MRLKIAVPVLLLCLLCLVMMFYARPRQQDVPSPAAGAVETSTNADSQAVASAPPARRVRATTPPVTQTDPVIEKETHEQFVTRRISELMDLAMTDDSNSLRTILAELSNPDAEIREAAVTAAVQFKSPDAIPALREAYIVATEPEEKLRIRNAIDFLSASN